MSWFNSESPWKIAGKKKTIRPKRLRFSVTFEKGKAIVKFSGGVVEALKHNTNRINVIGIIFLSFTTEFTQMVGFFKAYMKMVWVPLRKLADLRSQGELTIHGTKGTFTYMDGEFIWVFTKVNIQIVPWIVWGIAKKGRKNHRVKNPMVQSGAS